MRKHKVAIKIINLLYTIIIPVTPLLLHIFVNILTKVDIKLEYIYPELFFAAISICIESIKSLQLQLRNNELKQLILLVVQTFFVLSSVSYGSILVINNLPSVLIDTEFALLSSLTIFISGIIVYIAILIIREV